ncbi:UNVERIFIED_CONTAM: hypothetical protein NCL1_35671 [Trichonephila clavipes]
MIGDSLYVKLRLLNAENPAGIQIEEDGYLEIRHFDLVKAGLEVTSLTAYLDNMDFVAKQFFLLKIFSRKRCLEKAKLKRQEKIANESDIHKRQRSEKISLAVAKHRENESLEQRTNRQNTDRIHTQDRKKNESLEQRTNRQDIDRIHTQERRKN